MAIESGGGGKQDPHKDIVLGASPVHKSLWETPLTEVVTSALLGTKQRIIRGDVTAPLFPALRDWLPGKIGEPKVKPDTVTVYEVRENDPKKAVEKTDPKHWASRSFYRKDQKKG